MPLWQVPPSGFLLVSPDVVPCGGPMSDGVVRFCLPAFGGWLATTGLRPVVGCILLAVGGVCLVGWWALRGFVMPYAGIEKIVKVQRPSHRPVGTGGPTGWFSECGRYRLTMKQKRFCDEYLSRGLTKPFEALLEAGYKPGGDGSARAAVKTLLEKPNVRAYIELMKPKYEGKLLLTRDYVVEGLKAVAEGSRNDNAKVAALKHLGQYLGMWVERTEVTGADGQPIAFADAGGALAGVSDENLRRVKELLSARKPEDGGSEVERAVN